MLLLLRMSLLAGLTSTLLTACGSPAVTEYRVGDASRLQLSGEPLIIKRYQIEDFELRPEDEAAFQRDPAALASVLASCAGSREV